MSIIGAKMPQKALDEFVATQLALADADASGRLSFEEFVDYYNSICDLPVVAMEQKAKAEAAAAAEAALKAEKAGARNAASRRTINGGAMSRHPKSNPGAKSAMDDYRRTTHH
jgi:hypothetical protein